MKYRRKSLHNPYKQGPFAFMQFTTRASTEMRESMDAYGIGPALQEQFTRCISFHTVTAPGLFIGVFMVDYALELLGARHE